MIGLVFLRIGHVFASIYRLFQKIRPQNAPLFCMSLLGLSLIYPHEFMKCFSKIKNNQPYACGQFLELLPDDFLKKQSQLGSSDY